MNSNATRQMSFVKYSPEKSVLFFLPLRYYTSGKISNNVYNEQGCMRSANEFSIKAVVYWFEANERQQQQQQQKQQN